MSKRLGRDQVSKARRSYISPAPPLLVVAARRTSLAYWAVFLSRDTRRKTAKEGSHPAGNPYPSSFFYFRVFFAPPDASLLRSKA